MNDIILCRLLIPLLCFSLTACSISYSDPDRKQKQSVNKQAPAELHCVGEVTAPAVFATMLSEVDAPELVAKSIGSNDNGGLCTAKAYKVTQSFEVFRAWNSLKPESELGRWWSFSMPSGKISAYREKYAICPEYSPLDMMVRCSLVEGSILVLGTGQSASCQAKSQYPASPAIQIYLPDAPQATEHCQSFYGVFSWQNRATIPGNRTMPEEPGNSDDGF